MNGRMNWGLWYAAFVFLAGAWLLAGCSWRQVDPTPIAQKTNMGIPNLATLPAAELQQDVDNANAYITAIQKELWRRTAVKMEYSALLLALLGGVALFVSLYFSIAILRPVAFVLFGSAALLYFLGEFLPWLKLGVAFMAVTAIVYFVAFVHGNAAEQLGPLARKIKAPKLAPDTVTLAEGPSSTVKG